MANKIHIKKLYAETKIQMVTPQCISAGGLVGERGLRRVVPLYLSVHLMT